MHWDTQLGGGGGGWAVGLQPPQSKIKKKNKDFIDTMISEVLSYLRFSLNQVPRLSDDEYVGVLKNIIKMY
jgi:hypothetical protein